MNTKVTKFIIITAGGLAGGLAGALVSNYIVDKVFPKELGDGIQFQPELPFEEGNTEMQPIPLTNTLWQKEPIEELMRKNSYISNAAPVRFVSSSDDEETEDEETEDEETEDEETEDEYGGHSFITEFDYADSLNLKRCFTYYVKDDVLVDDSDNVVTEVEPFSEALVNFGRYSADPDCVYVRDAEGMTDYEITRINKSYSSAVLGIPEKTEKKKSRSKKVVEE